VRAVLYLATRDPQLRVPTAEIGQQQKIPVTFLAKIVAQLAAAGILHSTRGAHGGVSLGRPADEISLLEIVEAIDGPMLLNDCVADPTACPVGDTCPVHPVWCEAQSELVSKLGRTTFAQLIGQPGSVAALPQAA
jgi:Rrf2 family protein